MGKASRAKKERRAARLRGEPDPKQAKRDLRLLDNAPVITKDMIIAYLVTKFIGKTGYKYISIGRYGSLLMNANSTDIVAVNVHRDFPNTSVRGRYNDPQKRDISVNAFHVVKDFPGIVVDRQANVYIGDSNTVATAEEVNNVLTDFRKVTGVEYNKALEEEQPFIKAQLEKMKEQFEQTKANVEKALNESVSTPYEDATPYEEAIEPEVLDDCEPIVQESSSVEVKDAEVIE